MYDSASGVVTSLSATTRSTSRPSRRNSPSATRSTMAPLASGRRTTTPSRSDHGLTGLVDERRQLSDDLGHPLSCHRRHDRPVPAESRRAPRPGPRRPWCRRRRAGDRAAQGGTRRARATGSVPAPTGETPSSCARSTMMHITRARSTWRRNWWPSPRPSLAPSIRPGMSATTKSVSSSRLHHAEVRFERRERDSRRSSAWQPRSR